MHVDLSTVWQVVKFFREIRCVDKKGYPMTEPSTNWLLPLSWQLFIWFSVIRVAIWGKFRYNLGKLWELKLVLQLYAGSCTKLASADRGWNWWLYKVTKKSELSLCQMFQFRSQMKLGLIDVKALGSMAAVSGEDHYSHRNSLVRGDHISAIPFMSVNGSLTAIWWGEQWMLMCSRSL